MSPSSALQVPYEIFPEPPLKAMLGQVRFPPVLKIADLGALGAFQDHIRDEWPQFAQEQQINFVLGPGVAPQAAGGQNVSRFTTTDDRWSIVLAPDVMTLEAGTVGQYSSYEQFSARFRQAWSAVEQIFKPTGITRQGLRYLDHIEGARTAQQWQELINPELLAPLTGTLEEEVVQAVAEYRLKREDGILVFKHGMVSAGPQNTPGYLLDFDYFTDDEATDVSVETLMDRFDSYHDAIYARFRWCVTDAALELFRGHR